MKRRVVWQGVAVLVLSLIVTQAEATLVKSMNLQELVGDAEYIVKAKVTAKDTQNDPDESGMIVTYYTLKVEDYVKGTPHSDNQMVIKQVAQGMFTTASGKSVRQNFYFPEYQVGRTYLLFLPEAHERTGLLAPVGLQQGAFNIVNRDGTDDVPQLRSRRAMLGRNLSQKNPSTRFLSTQLSADVTSTSYDSFKTLIQTVGGAE